MRIAIVDDLAAERALHADRAVLRQRHGLDEIAVSGADPAADQLLRQGVRLLRRGAGAEQRQQEKAGKQAGNTHLGSLFVSFFVSLP